MEYDYRVSDMVHSIWALVEDRYPSGSDLLARMGCFPNHSKKQRLGKLTSKALDFPAKECVPDKGMGFEYSAFREELDQDIN